MRGDDPAILLLPTELHDSAMTALQPKRRDAVRHRQRILAAARDLFAERGVDAVTMQQIGRTAGVGQGTLYRHFPQKGAVCAALLFDQVTALHTQIVAAVASDSPRDTLDGLADALTLIAQFTDENAPLLRAMLSISSQGQVPSTLGGPLHIWLRAVVVATLQRAVTTGDLPPLDAEGLADTLLAALAPDAYLYRRHVLGQSPDRIVASLRDLLFALRPSSQLL